jgi:hypothetical protein
MFTSENGQLTPIVVQAPGGGFNPEFNAIFAQNLGFGPPPPGAQPMAPPQMHMQQQPQHNMGAGTFDMGGGQQLHVKINGKTPEGYLADKASSMIWGWIIGAAIIGLIVVILAGVGIYVYATAGDPTSSTATTPAAAAKAAAAASWDGKTPFECSANDKIALAGVVATAGVKASGNCQLTLTGVSITAPVAIEASSNAKVTMTGGSITASTSSVVASGNAKVDLAGTKVTGKSKASGLAKITGAN